MAPDVTPEASPPRAPASQSAPLQSSPTAPSGTQSATSPGAAAGKKVADARPAAKHGPLMRHGVVLPRVVHKVDAIYPEDTGRAPEKDEETEVRVVIGLTVDHMGHPLNVHISKPASDAAFNASAMKAVEQYKFKPAIRRGKPIDYPFAVTVAFLRTYVEDEVKPSGLKQPASQ